MQQGMRWIGQAWGEMGSGVIRSCWCHTKIVGEDVDANVEMLMQRDLCGLDSDI